MSFQHPGLGRVAQPEAVAPRETKIDALASMKHLLQLQMRSKAPQLKTRLAASLILVLSGKALGVWAPLVMGAAVIYTTIVLFANLAGDLMLPVVDPRRRA